MARCGLAARFRRYRCSARVPFPPARMEATRRRRPSPNKAGRSSHHSKSAGSAAQTEEASGGARAEYWAAMSGVPVILCGWCHAAHCHVVPDRKKVIGRDLLDGARDAEVACRRTEELTFQAQHAGDVRIAR